jgi:hypothetical protein
LSKSWSETSGVFEGEEGTISGENLLECNSGVRRQPDGSRFKAAVVSGVNKKKLLREIFE